MNQLLKYVIHFLGWKVEHIHFGQSAKKAVFAVGPHTSNWDFFLGLLIRKVYRIPTRFLAKKSLFKFPIGGLMRWLGGYPVDRNKHQGMVEQVVNIFTNEPEFLLSITPEGTRSKVDQLKSGFYYIAHKAQVPIIPVALDFENKIVRFYPPIPPDTPKEDVLKHITEIFKKTKGKRPELGI